MGRLGEGERQVRLGQDRLAIKKRGKNGNEQKLCTLFYPHPKHKAPHAVAK
jgi:hypothetical protein